MEAHVVDGTHELFRHYYALPSRTDSSGQEVAAVRGVVGSMIALLKGGATHVGVATDHVVESFRNDLFDGYKTGDGMDPVLYSQFPLLEEALDALGVVVWPMVELEADDGLASAAALLDKDESVSRVLIASPDKDLAQCVRGERVVLWDRKGDRVLDEPAVVEKFGVGPASIPSYLALVGDSADGIPGLPGWGAKSAALLLSAYGDLDAIPDEPEAWPVRPRGAAKLAETLRAHRKDAELYRTLATLRADARLFRRADELRWQGPKKSFAGWAERLGGRRWLEWLGELAKARV